MNKRHKVVALIKGGEACEEERLLSLEGEGHPSDLHDELRTILSTLECPDAPISNEFKFSKSVTLAVEKATGGEYRHPFVKGDRINAIVLRDVDGWLDLIWLDVPPPYVRINGVNSEYLFVNKWDKITSPS